MVSCNLELDLDSVVDPDTQNWPSYSEDVPVHQTLGYHSRVIIKFLGSQAVKSYSLWLLWPWPWPDDLHIWIRLMYLHTKNEFQFIVQGFEKLKHYRHTDSDTCYWMQYHTAFTSGINKVCWANDFTFKYLIQAELIKHYHCTCMTV